MRKTAFFRRPLGLLAATAALVLLLVILGFAGSYYVGEHASRSRQNSLLRLASLSDIGAALDASLSWQKVFVGSADPKEHHRARRKLEEAQRHLDEAFGALQTHSADIEARALRLADLNSALERLAAMTNEIAVLSATEPKRAEEKNRVQYRSMNDIAKSLIEELRLRVLQQADDSNQAHYRRLLLFVLGGMVALFVMLALLALSQVLELRAKRALSESEERQKTILDSLQIGVMLIDKASRCVVEVNPAAARMIGQDRKDIVGRSCRDFFRIGEHESCPMHGRSGIEGEEREILTASGKGVPVLKAAVEVKLDGKPHYLESFIDLTVRKQLEAQLNQAAKMEAVGRLAGGVAHDLNNMLGPIIGYCDLLLHGSSLTDPVRNNVESILEAGMRSRDLVKQLLSFGRKQTFQLKDLSLSEVLTKFYHLVRRALREDIVIELTLPASVDLIHADAGLLEQVMMNLAVNAQDAMPGGGKLVIEARSAELEDKGASRKGLSPGRYVCLRVTDTGMGMDRQIQEHIFEPFFTTKEEGRGTGLGLATVYGIVEQLHGAIFVDSQPGKGACFEMWFPVSHGLKQKAKLAAQPPRLRGGGETVLVAEDDESVRETAAAMLKELGYTVIVSQSASECLCLAEDPALRLDLLLTDVVMPNMNGKILYETLRQKRPGLRAVFMSGYTGDLIAEQGLVAKNIHLLQKPFTLADMASVLRRALETEILLAD